MITCPISGRTHVAARFLLHREKEGRAAPIFDLRRVGQFPESEGVGRVLN
jgi:hypothetical protein